MLPQICLFNYMSLNQTGYHFKQIQFLPTFVIFSYIQTVSQWILDPPYWIGNCQNVPKIDVANTVIVKQNNNNLMFLCFLDISFDGLNHLTNNFLILNRSSSFVIAEPGSNLSHVLWMIIGNQLMSLSINHSLLCCYHNSILWIFSNLLVLYLVVFGKVK